MDASQPVDSRAAVRAAHHATVYHLLRASTGPLPPAGLDGAIGRAQLQYDCDEEPAALLAEMNLAIFRLRQALLAGAEDQCLAERAAIARLAEAWLYQAPLSHVAALFPDEGRA